MEPLAAGGEDGESRTGGEQASQDGRTREQMLEIVQHKKDMTPVQDLLECDYQGLASLLLHAESRGDGSRKMARGAHRSQGDDVETICVLGPGGGGDAQGKAGLANAARAG